MADQWRLVRVLFLTPAPQACVARREVILRATRLVDALPLGVLAPRRPLILRSRCGPNVVLRPVVLSAARLRLSCVRARRGALSAAATYA